MTKRSRTRKRTRAVSTRALTWTMVVCTVALALLLAPGVAHIARRGEPEEPKLARVEQTRFVQAPAHPTFDPIDLIDSIDPTDPARAETDLAIAPSQALAEPSPQEAVVQANAHQSVGSHSAAAPRVHAALAEVSAAGSALATDLQGPFDCIIEPLEIVEVGTALRAVVTSVEVERSDFVVAGQVLARLESDVEERAVEIARARAQMRGDIEASQANVVLGFQKQQRASQLFERETLSTGLLEEIQAEAEVAKAGLQQAKERQQLMKLQLQEAIDRLTRRVIRSPIDGVVIKRMKSPGEVVNEEAILTVAQIDPLGVEVILPAAMFGTISRGMRVEIEPELSQSGVRSASVVIVDKVVDAASGTFAAWLELPNPDHSIPSGLHCQARFVGGSMARSGSRHSASGSPPASQ